jgi:hypothetical protein
MEQEFRFGFDGEQKPFVMAWLEAKGLWCRGEVGKGHYDLIVHADGRKDLLRKGYFEHSEEE